jgi:hypothetical protein
VPGNRPGAKHGHNGICDVAELWHDFLIMHGCSSTSTTLLKQQQAQFIRLILKITGLSFSRLQFAAKLCGKSAGVGF